MKRAAISAVLAIAAILGSGTAAQASPYDKLVGDSLSDNGNLYRATQLILPFGLAVPGPPYYNGRLSNGPVYNEYLAQSLGTSIGPAMTGGSNYAFAAAATDYYSASFLGLEQLFGFPSIIDGVIAYGEPLYNDGIVPSPNSLHIVWAGANNLLDLIEQVTLVRPTLDLDPANPLDLQASAALSEFLGSLATGYEAFIEDAPEFPSAAELDPGEATAPRLERGGTVSAPSQKPLEPAFELKLVIAQRRVRNTPPLAPP